MKLNYKERMLIDKNGDKFKCYFINLCDDNLINLKNISNKLNISLKQLIDIVKKFNGEKYTRYTNSEFFYYFKNEEDVQNALLAIVFIFNI